MSENPALFPVWSRWSGCVARQSQIFTRVIHARSDSDQLVAFLTLHNGTATFSARWESSGSLVCPLVAPLKAEGIASLARAMEWAEWQIKDMGGKPRKRAPRRIKEAA